MQQCPTTHRVVLIVEVDEPTDLNAADFIAMADVLREAAAELAPQGTTRASVELGVIDPKVRPSAPSSRASWDEDTPSARTA